MKAYNQVYHVQRWHALVLSTLRMFLREYQNGGDYREGSTVI